MRRAIRAWGTIATLALIVSFVGSGQDPELDGVLSHQGRVDLQVWMGTQPYVANSTLEATTMSETYEDFIHFAIDAQAYAYLLDFSPDGQVKLLLTRELEGRAVPYDYPSDFTDHYTVPGSVGKHLVQLLVTEQPLDLGREGEIIGTDPGVVLNGLRLLIAQHRIGLNQWSADWTAYEALASRPFPPTPKAYLGIFVLHEDEQTPLHDATLTIDGGEATAVEQGNLRLLSVGQYDLRAQVLGTELTSCWVEMEEAGVREPKSYRDPCMVRLTKAGQKAWVTFIYKGPEPIPGFSWVPLNSRNVCVGKEVRFNGSISQPAERITQYQWDFNEPGFASEPREEAMITYAFRRAGDHDITLTIHLDDGSETASATRDLTVFPIGQGGCAPPNPHGAHGEASADETTGMLKATRGSAWIVSELSLPDGFQAGDSVEFTYEYRFSDNDFVEKMEQQSMDAFSFIHLLVDDEYRLGCFPLPHNQPPAGGVGAFAAQSCGKLTLDVVPEKVEVLTFLSAVDASETSSTAVELQFRNVRLDPLGVTGPLCPEARLETDKRFYLPGQPVHFSFHNGCDFPVTTDTWTIRDDETGQVFYSDRNPLMVPPGSHADWSWNQRDRFGQFASVCSIYRLELETDLGLPGPIHFAIVPSQGTCLVWP